MEKKQKNMLIRIVATVLLFVGALLLSRSAAVTNIFKYNNMAKRLLLLALYLPAYLLIGWDILKKAGQNVVRGGIFDENFLMSLATIGAFVIGEYPEAVIVMLFYQVGEFFQSYAVGRSRQSIAELMDIRPDYANIMRDGQIVQVDPYDVSVGDHIIVSPGEKVPLDGTVLEGKSSLDTSALTGEATPRTITEGAEALSGCINLTGVLTIEVTKEFDESTVSKILELVENASSHKAETENFITRFAKIYTPLVVLAALLLAIVPPLVLTIRNWNMPLDGSVTVQTIISAFGYGDMALLRAEYMKTVFSDYVYRALTFLVISCPCALVLSVPLSFFGGIGGASRNGILVKGSNYLEALGHTEVVVMDKTGTLTHGEFKVQQIYPAPGWTAEELLDITAHVEYYSSHPISLSLKNAYGKELDSSRIAEAEELAGHGVNALVDQRAVMAGNLALMEKEGITPPTIDFMGTIIYVAVAGNYAGAIDVADRIKDDAAETIQTLTKRGIRTVMLTGDNQTVGEKVASSLGITEVHTGLLPDDKVRIVAELMKQTSEKGKLAFVGDGINDAPVLAQSDIGIAMGALGSDAAIEAADVVLMDDKPSKIVTAIDIAKKTVRIVMQNIIFALGIKLLVLVLGAFGLTNMWGAVFADVGVSVLAVLNAMRALHPGNSGEKVSGKTIPMGTVRQ